MRIHALAITTLLVPAMAGAQPPPAASSSAAASTTAEPPAHGWTVAIAPRVGLVVPTASLGPMVIGGVQVDIATPALDHRLLVGIDGSIARPSHDGSVMDQRIPGGSATYSIHELEGVIAILASYRLAGPDRPFVPWIGAGPMLHLLRTSESTSITPKEADNTEVSTELGVELAGGADVRLGPGYLGGDLRVAYSKLDHKLTGSTNAGKIAVTASYRLTF